MGSHFNDLDPDELERLAILLEEMGEAQQAIGKILRHGYGSRNPNDINSLTNREMLEAEIGDVLYAIDILWKARDIRRKNTEDCMATKAEKIQQYLHHQ